LRHARVPAAIWLIAGAVLIAGTGELDTLSIDSRESRVLIHVGKAGAFGFAGHAHEVEAPVRGTVTLDTADIGRSEVTVEFESASLRVTGKGEPARDVPEVQRVMLSDKVLDVARFPKIGFRSRRVSRVAGSDRQLSLSVEGDLTLHGVTRSCVVPLRVTFQEGALSVEGRTTVNQTAFGIQPVVAAGGTVRVKDALEIEFAIRASK